MVTVGYMLVAMWVAWLGGVATHAVIDANTPPVVTESQCVEARGPIPVDAYDQVDKGAENE